MRYVIQQFQTRSGKIMRRLLRNITNGDNDFGDISVVADVEHLEHVIQRFNAKNQLVDT